MDIKMDSRMVEIERKFLVDGDKWTSERMKSTSEGIIQTYLSKSAECTVRIRIKGDKGFITIKGKTTGISRSEYEYEIPLDEAKALIEEFGGKTIEKIRYTLLVGMHTWEIDEFKGKLEGLILAEIELQNENEQFEVPHWVTTDVSDDINYYNSKLIDRC
jgi:adenylate cyclase